MNSANLQYAMFFLALSAMPIISHLTYGTEFDSNILYLYSLFFLPKARMRNFIFILSLSICIFSIRLSPAWSTIIESEDLYNYYQLTALSPGAMREKLQPYEPFFSLYLLPFTISSLTYIEFIIYFGYLNFVVYVSLLYFTFRNYRYRSQLILSSVIVMDMLMFFHIPRQIIASCFLLASISTPFLTSLFMGALAFTTHNTTLVFLLIYKSTPRIFLSKYSVLIMSLLGYLLIAEYLAYLEHLRFIPGLDRALFALQFLEDISTLQVPALCLTIFALVLLLNKKYLTIGTIDIRLFNMLLGMTLLIPILGYRIAVVPYMIFGGITVWLFINTKLLGQKL